VARSEKIPARYAGVWGTPKIEGDGEAPSRHRGQAVPRTGLHAAGTGGNRQDVFE
jgi:hypothetical protein